MTTDKFIQKAKKVHGDRYDYSKAEYIGYKDDICIICPEHGAFWQKAKNHLSGYGCSICSGRKKMRTIDFVNRANLVHQNKYDYSKTVYKGNKEKICIICPEHGEFWQQASSHLKGIGCPQCGIIKSSSKQKIWTKEKCYEAALKYTDLGTFSKECQVAYVIAHRNGWIIDYTWLNRKKLPNGYLTKELVMKEARKYTSSHDFMEGSRQAYNAARRRGWIKECVWFKKPRNAKKWDYNTCYEEALKFTSKIEFRKNANTAYCVARNHGWLVEYKWLKNYDELYNYDECFVEAQKYKYYSDFRTNSHPYYMVARKRGWLKEFSWLIKEYSEPHNKKWNYDTCYEEAKKYATKGAFGKGASGAYDVARRNGWLSDYTWFPDFSASDAKVDSVYCYYFKEQNAVYVGRTLMYRQHIRDVEHNNYETDTVYKFAHLNNCTIPQMRIIEEYLTIQQGREREDYWRKQFETEGRTILNKAATGGRSSSIGALARGKWTFEKAYKIAKAFQTVNELCEEYGYLYKIAKAKGWLEKFDWFRGKEIRVEKQTKWTEEVCRKEALKYNSRKDFRKYCKGAYDKAKEMGWLQNYTWLTYNKPHSEWDYNSCKEEASKYSNRNEFGKSAYGAYTCARKNGWLDDFYPIPLRRYFDYDTCKRMVSKYQSLNDLLINDRSLYESIRKKGWLDNFFPKDKTTKENKNK